jgi:hypothetical protein
MVFDDQAGEWFAHDETDIEGEARILPNRTTRALKNGDVIGIGEHDVSRRRVGNHLFDSS